MIIGVPKEIKSNEHRIAITPAGVEAFVNNGHEVCVESGGGLGSGFSDNEYKKAGAKMIDTPAGIFEKADMILKVKEPLPEEFDYFKPGQILFTFLHLAADKKMTEALMEKEIVGIAYETVELPDRSLPLLTPMSEVAGRLSVQMGIRFLEKLHGGKGVLLGGIPGVLPGKVTVIGGGIVGTNAAKMAVGLGADVTIIDISTNRLRELDDLFSTRAKTLMSNSYNIKNAVKESDLVIGAVLIPGAKAPQLVTEDMIQEMEAGSVVVDVAIDQGGCIETCDHPTTHADPVYTKHDVIHYSVANMPGAVARSSTLGLTNATLPYALRIANKGYEKAIKEDNSLLKGLNLLKGNLTYKAVADSLELPYKSVENLL